MGRTRSFWRAVAMVLMCGALALPALARNTSDMTNANGSMTTSTSSVAGSTSLATTSAPTTTTRYGRSATPALSYGEARSPRPGRWGALPA